MSESMLKELRATKPAAPEELRDRVRAIARDGARARALSRPAPVHFEWRRLVLVAPGTLVVASAAAGVIGLTAERHPSRQRRGRSGRPRHGHDARPAARRPDRGLVRRDEERRSAGDKRRRGRRRPGPGPAPALPGRAADQGGRRRGALQRDEARAADRRLARRPRHRALVRRPGRGRRRGPDHLRIPTARIESAVAQLSELGTILRQRYGIEDLQPQADTLQAQIETHSGDRRILKQLANPNSATRSGPSCSRGSLPHGER